jgi:hypothetical protein
MITNFKIFEEYEMTSREKLLSYATLYIEESLGITKEKGFREAEYTEHSWSKFVTINLYFNNWTEEKDYESVYKFIKNNKLEILRELVMTDIFEIDIKISEYKIKKFAELYTAMIKYNL